MWFVCRYFTSDIGKKALSVIGLHLDAPSTALRSHCYRILLLLTRLDITSWPRLRYETVEICLDTFVGPNGEQTLHVSAALSSATVHVIFLLSPDLIAVPGRRRMCWPLALNWGLTWLPFNIYQERAILYAHLIAEGSQLIIKWYTRQHILWLLQISEEALLFERTGIVRPQEKSWALPQGVERRERAALRKPWCLSL